MGLAAGGTPLVQVDGLTTSFNSADAVQVAEPVMQTISDAIVGAIVAESTAEFFPSDMEADYFSTNVGRNSTVDNAASTLTYDAGNKKYAADYSSGSATEAVTSYDTGEASAIETGVKITASANSTVVGVNKDPTSDGANAYIRDAAGNQLATATFVANHATFNYAITSGTTYFITIDAGSVRRRKAISFPITDSRLSVISGIYNGPPWTVAGGNAYAIVSIELTWTSATTQYIKTAALPLIDGSVAAVCLYPYRLALGTGNTITFDVDYTGNGSYEQTGMSPGAWVDLGGAQTFTNAKVRINLNKAAGDAATKPSLAGYSFMVR